MAMHALLPRRVVQSGAAFLMVLAGWAGAEDAVHVVAFDGVVTVSPADDAEDLRAALAVFGIATAAGTDAAPGVMLDDGTSLDIDHDDDIDTMAGRIADRLATRAPGGGTGDPDYGAYLAQECASCHIAGGTDAVPGIDGIAPGYFRLAMAQYAAGIREHAAMANVARSLGGEELAAMAAHFANHSNQSTGN